MGLPLPPQATKMLNEEIAGLVSGLRSTSGSSLSAFSRMEERVLAMEAEAEASSQLGGVRARCQAMSLVGQHVVLIHIHKAKSACSSLVCCSTHHA